MLRAAGLSDVYYSRGFVEASALLVDGAPVLLRLAGAGGDVFLACVVRERPGRRRDAVRLRRAGRRAARAAARGVPRRLPGVVRAARGGVELRRLPPAAAATPTRPPPRAFAAARSPARSRGRSTGRPARRDAPAPPAARAARAAGGQEAAVEPAPGDLDEFVGLYEQTMRRAGASPFYFFPRRLLGGAAAGVRLVRVDVRRGGELLASVLGHGRAAVAALPPRRRRGRGRAGPARATSRSTRSPRWGQRARLHDAAPRRRRRRPRGLAARATSCASRPAGSSARRSARPSTTSRPTSRADRRAAAVDWDGVLPRATARRY